MSVSSMTVGGKIKFKIVLLGDQNVGKSATIQRFINDRFDENYNATIGIDFLIRNIVHQNKTYRLQLWDTAGQERFRALIPSYLKDSHCGIIMYDIADSKTLDHVNGWLDFYNENKEAKSVAVIVGNKIDMPPSDNTCQQAEIQAKAQKYGVPHYKISAKNGDGILELFKILIDLINNAMKKDNFSLIPEKKQEQQNVGTTSTVMEPVSLGKAESSFTQHKKQACC